MVKEGNPKRLSATTRFVVHEHHATHLHYDFRLEMDGVLKSWAIPKGPSMNPTDKRLAIMVEDHPLEYAKFEGVIPEGHYGAGAVVIWDKGYYLPLEDKRPEEQLKTGKISFVLKGQKLKGGFTLTLLRGRGSGNQWLLIKKKDDQVDKNWKIKPILTDGKRRQLKPQIPPCRTS